MARHAGAVFHGALAVGVMSRTHAAPIHGACTPIGSLRATCYACRRRGGSPPPILIARDGTRDVTMVAFRRIVCRSTSCLRLLTCGAAEVLCFIKKKMPSYRVRRGHITSHGDPYRSAEMTLKLLYEDAAHADGMLVHVARPIAHVMLSPVAGPLLSTPDTENARIASHTSIRCDGGRNATAMAAHAAGRATGTSWRSRNNRPARHPHPVSSPICRRLGRTI